MVEPVATSPARAADSQIIDEVRQGRRKSIARAMSMAEMGKRHSRALLTEIHRHCGRAHLIGLTGVPGSGKSTMVRALAQKFRGSGRKVGIVAVDPSSPFSGGAILGDRIRMLELAGDPGVFIRSMATRGALGGLARASHDVVDVLDAAGYDVVLIETVGVGQDEVDIVQAAHTVIVVSAPGLGDEIQAIKAGVLEIADIHVVSKCDRPEANQTVTDLKSMLKLGSLAREPSGWQIPVIPTSAQQAAGIDDLMERIDRHRNFLRESGELTIRRRRIIEMRILKAAEDILREQLLQRNRSDFEALLDRVTAGELHPLAAACSLLGEIDPG